MTHGGEQKSRPRRQEAHGQEAQLALGEERCVDDDGARRGHGGKTSKTKRHVSSAAGQALNYRTGTQSVTKPRAVRVVKALSASAPYSAAEEESVVRLAHNAEASRSNPGEDLTGLSDQEFLGRLLG